jgi:hypothetical protein
MNFVIIWKPFRLQRPHFRFKAVEGVFIWVEVVIDILVLLRAGSVFLLEAPSLTRDLVQIFWSASIPGNEYSSDGVNAFIATRCSRWTSIS